MIGGTRVTISTGRSDVAPAGTEAARAAVSFPSPAGVPARTTSAAASRSTSLAGQTVVILNNGQAHLELAAYGEVIEWLAGSLARLDPPATLVHLREDLVSAEAAVLRRLEQEIVDLAPAGVVIALCHAGVTAPSTLLAGALERAGVPSVLVCTPLGTPLATLMVSHDVPELPIVSTVPVRGLATAELDQLTAEISTQVHRALTEQPVAPERSGVAVDATDVRVGSARTSVADVEWAATLSEDLWTELLDLRLNDGLPVVLPTAARVRDMIDASGRSPDEVLLSGPMPSHAHITVEKVAVNAVLAGCRPEYLPVVIAAVEAMAEDEFRFFQTAITTHPGGLALAVSGPFADEIGLASGPGCLGPGFRANATVGRAVSMTVTNVARAIPGVTSLATFGSPAQYSYCFAEQRAGNPWAPLHTEIQDELTSTVTVLKCESAHNVISNAGPGPEALLKAAASVLSTLGTNGIRWPGDHLVIINPAQARMLDLHGFTKRDVQMFLFDRARVPAADFDTTRYEECRPRWTHNGDNIPIVRDPSDFRIFVAGGIGNQMMVAPPWGLSRAVTKPIAGKK